jgi:curved DNA-binding protein CbpA
MNFSNYYRTLGLPDFSPIEMVISSFEYNSKALLPVQDDDPTPTEALDALKQAYNVLGDPGIKDSYDIALQDHLNLIREDLNYYAILNIPEFTSVGDDINDGHFYEVMRFKPPEDHAETLAYIAEAYAVLVDPEKKETYDAELRLKRTSSEKDGSD